jgi:hypothetical protein
MGQKRVARCYSEREEVCAAWIAAKDLLFILATGGVGAVKTGFPSESAALLSASSGSEWRGITIIAAVLRRRESGREDDAVVTAVVDAMSVGVAVSLLASSKLSSVSATRGAGESPAILLRVSLRLIMFERTAAPPSAARSCRTATA